MAGKSYAGQSRRKQTPWSVKFGDALASRVIAVGGIGTIVAILLVVLVLVGTALPLINGPDFKDSTTLKVPEYSFVGVDADGVMTWGLTAEGTVEVRETIGGELLATYPVDQDDEVEVTASYVSIDRETVALGFSDGTIRVAKLSFEDALIANADLPEEEFVTEEQKVAHSGDTVYQWFDSNTARKTRLEEPEWSSAYEVADEPVLAVDFLPSSSSNRFARSTVDHAVALTKNKLVHCTITKSKRLGRVRESTELIEAEVTARSQDGRPLTLAAMNSGGQVVIAWPNGTLDRFEIGDDSITLMESQSTTADGSELRSAGMLLARQTLLCGTESGELQGWAIVREETENTINADGLLLAKTHSIQISSSPIVAVASSKQSHVAVAADSSGNALLAYVTNNTFLGSRETSLGGDLSSVCLGPDGNMLVASSSGTLELASFDVGHPEASVQGYFGRVWYEAHDSPKYIWQSSAATEEAEIKLSLMPLIFGTMKATVYAMLISVPLAILAAIYTSEFLSSEMRGRVKPLVELMASLPSVVLGYVAALVVAPYLQEHLMPVLAALVLVPVTFVLAGHLWSLLPVDLLVRLQAFRLPLMCVCLPLGCLLAYWFGNGFESWMFSGDLVAWLSDDEASSTGGWMLILIPILTLAAVLLTGGPLAPWIREYATGKSPRGFALFSISRFLLTSIAVLAGAWGISLMLSQFGLDLRGTVVDDYQDKNALLVGGALGFCVIPIIYTISDDALQAVPKQLRSASLGCGATPWQTTVRVVVPSAMSGLFSAVMIGLGRAVGETMVVLCAAGNTPLMEWNIFNGFKTLSAALATELPEAAKGSTHFRTLFLAALVLFFITLIANTLAEFVRIRFRKRASQL